MTPDRSREPGGVAASAPVDVLTGLDADDAVLLRATPPDLLADLGCPEVSLAADRIRAYARLVDLLGSEERIRVSPLGPAWSTDFDVAGNPPHDPAELGWLRADAFLDELASPGRGRWYITDQIGKPIGVADFELDRNRWTGPSPDDVVNKVIGRALERGSVGLRETLELRWAIRRGAALPDNEVIAAAASVEAALGGGDLAGSADALPARSIVTIADGRFRRLLVEVRRLMRPRLVIALSGVDGAGKSTLTAGLLAGFARVGLFPEVIWARPGMYMEWTEPLLRVVGHGRRAGRTPTVARVAAGDEVSAPSRSGVVGWVWAMLVTVTFLIHVWWRHLAAHSVVVFDRHRDDAIVSLDFVYAGVDLRLARWLIEHLMPPAARTIHLSIDAATAVARKPGDTFGHHAVSRQLLHYRRRLSGRSDVVVLDATAEPDRIIADAFRVIVGVGQRDIEEIVDRNEGAP